MTPIDFGVFENDHQLACPGCGHVPKSHTVDTERLVADLTLQARCGQCDDVAVEWIDGDEFVPMTPRHEWPCGCCQEVKR